MGAQGEIPLEPQILSSSFPAALVKAPLQAGLQPVQRGSAARLVPGMWILQIARQPGGTPLFTPGVYSGVAVVKCGAEEHRTVQSSIPLTSAALGAGLFDLDTNLLAVVMRCGSQFAAFVPEEIDAALAAANSLEGRLLSLYGLRVLPLGDASRQRFAADEGVWVSETLVGMRADTAGLVPGDVITALDDKAIRTPADLTPLLTAAREAVFGLQVRRNRRTIRLELPGSLTAQPSQQEAGPGSGIDLTPAPDGHPIESVAPGSAAARAGLMPGDRLLLVNGAQLPNLAAARRAIAQTGGTPSFLLIQRGGRKLGVFLP
jgi:S1-C subfamily serine protease